ncbi:MAG: T9SS type A sorting domain-containing protein [Bacteroidota bacterium]
MQKQEPWFYPKLVTFNTSFGGGYISVIDQNNFSRPVKSGSTVYVWAANGGSISFDALEQNWPTDPPGTPYYIWTFQNWLPNNIGIENPNQSSQTITNLNPEQSITGYYIKKFIVTFDRATNMESGNGGTYKVYGTSIGETGTATYLEDQPNIMSIEYVPVPGSGNVFVAWSDGNTLNPRRFYVPPDNGTSNVSIHAIFKNHLQSNSSTALSQPNQRKIIAKNFIDGTHTMHMVYQSGGDIFYSKNTGGVWSNEFPISVTGNALNPSIASTSTPGNYFVDIHIVWEEVNNGVHQLAYRRSTDNGTTWEKTFHFQDVYGDVTANTSDETPTIAGNNYPAIVWCSGNHDMLLALLAPSLNADGFTYYTFNVQYIPFYSIPRSPSLECGDLVFVNNLLSQEFRLVFKNSNDGKIYYTKFTLGMLTPTLQVVNNFSPSCISGTETDCGNPTITYNSSAGDGSYGSCDHVSWDGVNSGHRHIFYSRLNNSTKPWSTPVEIVHGTTGHEESKPSLSFDNRGVIWMTWECADHVAMISNPIGSPMPSTPGVANLGTGFTPSLPRNIGDGLSPWIVWGSGSTNPYTINLYQVAIPPAPALSSPANNATINTFTYTLSWSEAVGASSYNLQYANNSSFTGAINVNTGLTSSIVNLQEGLYYWRVNSWNGLGTSGWSATSQFTVSVPQNVSLQVFRSKNPDAYGVYHPQMTWGGGSPHFTLLKSDDTPDAFHAIVSPCDSGYYIDKTVPMGYNNNNGIWEYYKVTWNGGKSNVGSIESGEVYMDKATVAKPKYTSVAANYPNPFNPSTTFEYQLSTPGYVNMTLFNSLGQEVKKLVDEQKNEGYYNVRWDASSQSSGIYFVRVNITDKSGKAIYQDLKKVLLVK